MAALSINNVCVFQVCQDLTPMFTNELNISVLCFAIKHGDKLDCDKDILDSCAPKNLGLDHCDTASNLLGVACNQWVEVCGSVLKSKLTLVLGRHKSSLHKKNRHLPQLIEAMIVLGSSEAMAVSLVVQIAESMSLTLDQMREGQDCLLVPQRNRTFTHSQLRLPSLWDNTDRLSNGHANGSRAEH